ncbi:hypothetical protein O1611_g533 [Lasiodiplodia mahajangana]|uniref:Uncharacterized protein n=1 Tax=Lasiodiplodia mahajangana TaxID=1108764 RepID=A0ACC2K0V7_9PEZI|nr:hypothetical protein O1611_g533 [Lasiodiplodia mahajangana]
MSSNQMLSLIANDGLKVQASLQAVKQSIMLRTMFEDLDMPSDTEIPIPEVSGKILEKCMEWCEKHREDPHPLPEETKVLPEWDAKFFSDIHESQVVVGLINAANYLDIPLLLQYGISILVLRIQNMTTKEMCQYLNIDTDFTPEQVEQIWKDNEWARQRSDEHS